MHMFRITVLLFTLLPFFGIAAQPEMEWVFLPQDYPSGACASGTNCTTNQLCYGLKYTPAATGKVTSYTTGFLLECIGEGGNPIISNASCVMHDNSTIANACSLFDLIMINSSGNTGNLNVISGQPVFLHQICFQTYEGDTLRLREDPITDLTVSIDSVLNGGVETEFPLFQNTKLTRWHDNALYVNLTSTGGTNNGTNWANAFLRVEDAIAKAPECPCASEIWVAEGTYYPSLDTTREDSYRLLSHMKLIGGFNGIVEDTTDRDLPNNPTIMSGDLGIAGDISDNTYHLIETDTTVVNAVIDGFILTAANANGLLFHQLRGSAIYNQGHLTLRNITITNCLASRTGAAAYNVGHDAHLRWESCTVYQNISDSGSDIHNVLMGEMTVVGENVMME